MNSDGWYVLIEINNIKTGSKNITFRKHNVKPYGFDKIYMDRELILQEN